MSASEFFGLIIFLVFFQCFSVFVENPASERFQIWKKNAEEAEKLLEQGDYDIRGLEEIRRRLAEQREEALAMTEKGSVRLRSLQAQLTALGPAPAEVEVEPEEIAERRSELQQEIARIKAPLVNAE